MSYSKAELFDIFVRSPINKLAGCVTNQKNCYPDYPSLTKPEIVYIIDLLNRKRRILKKILHINTRSQHKNAMYKRNINVKQIREVKEPRSFDEYYRIGKATNILNMELAEMRKVRTLAYTMQHDFHTDGTPTSLS